MKGSASASSADLVATIVATVVALAVALLADSGPLAIAALLPLVLVLPGFALTALFFPPGAINRDLRLAMVVALSIGVAGLSGLVIQVFLDLDRGIVTLSLAALTIGAAALAWRERKRHRLGIAPVVLPHFSAASAIALLAAVAISGVAIAIASGGAHRQLDAARFSALWLVPKGGASVPPNGPPLVLGVSNREGRETGYRLMVTRGNSTVARWNFQLAPGNEWEMTLTATALPGEGPVTAQLDRDGRTYRRVALELDSKPSGGNG